MTTYRAPRRIAVVGSGIAGLSAAWLLGRQHQVTLFERHARPGMGMFNVDFDDERGSTRIDLPLRVFKSGYYDSLMALYRAAGVPMQSTDHSAAFSAADSDGIYYRYRNVRLGRFSFPLMATRLSRRSLTISRDALRFMFLARRDRVRGGAVDLTLEQYLGRNGYSKDFVEGMLLPSFAAICTGSYDAVRRYPAETIIDFYTSGSLFSRTWRARDGADDAIRQLLVRCQLRCGTEVLQVIPQGTGVQLRQRGGTAEIFDDVILAVQAHQARKLVYEHDRAAAELLQRVPHESSEVVVHRDERLVPPNAPEAPVHFLVDSRHDKPMATIRLNRIVPALSGRSPVFQTWNPLIAPREELVLGRAEFERPMVTLESRQAVAALARLQQSRERHIWYCGAYAMPGIPLLESAVQSAMSVASNMEVAIPWVNGGA